MPKVDNYIKFLKAFYDWEQQNHLTCIQECILMRILRRANASGWSEWIKVSNLELMLEMHMTSEVTFRNNRNRLIELGLIEYKAGKKGKPSSYKLNMPMKKEIVYKFSKNKHVENNSENINVKNMGDKIKVKTNANINVKSNVNNPQTPHEQYVSNTPKHKTINNKLNNIVSTNVLTRVFPQNARKETTVLEWFGEFWEAYPKKIGKKYALTCWKRIKNLDEDLVNRIISSVQKYKQTKQWAEGFVPNPSTFLNGERWEDEIDSQNNKIGGESCGNIGRWPNKKLCTEYPE